MKAPKHVVAEAALRELLREALHNDGAPGHDLSSPIVPNPGLDRPSLELDFDPVEVRFAPQSKNELIIMVRNLLDTVEDDQSAELYRRIKGLVAGDSVGQKDFGMARPAPPATDNVTRSTNMSKTNFGESTTLASIIRDIVQESTPGHQKPATLAESIRAIADEAIEEAKRKQKKAKASPKKESSKAKAKVKASDFGGGTLAEAVMRIADEALTEAGELPWGFGKGRFTAAGGFDTSKPGDEDDLEGPPSDTFRARGGSADDEVRHDNSPAFDPNEDIIDDDEKEAYLASLSASDWDPDGDDEDGLDAVIAAAGKKGSPRPRIDVGVGYGVDGDTFEKIGDKLGFTKEGAKKAVETAMERFKALHSLGPDKLAKLVDDGLDSYIAKLEDERDLEDDDIEFLDNNREAVASGDGFREYFSKFVKKAVRDNIADTQDDEDA